MERDGDSMRGRREEGEKTRKNERTKNIYVGKRRLRTGDRKMVEMAGKKD